MHGKPTIEVRGAVEHNLRNLDVSIDRKSITIITGMSGSGKSSLAFDTILAEAQRRFFYTLSHYSRQFLDLGSRPAVRHISGLSPAIALAQNETRPSRRASVGTLTDASELIGVLFARFGSQRCPKHQLATASQTVEEIAKRILASHPEGTVVLCAPVVHDKKGIFAAELSGFAERGYLRAFVDGKIMPLSPVPALKREEKHTIKLIVDHIKIKPQAEERLKRSIETCLKEGLGHGEYFQSDSKGDLILSSGGNFSTKGGCPTCGFSWPRLDTRHFSANSLGRCPKCLGLGFVYAFTEEGDSGEDHDDRSDGEHSSGTAPRNPCENCRGTGLSPEYGAVHLSGKSAIDFHGASLTSLHEILQSLGDGEFNDNPAFKRVTHEVVAALRRVIDIGLGYLTMSRRVLSLSGGELQRLKLAGVLSENLRGVLYVLDEPSQGLHPADIERLWRSLAKLRDDGNTILVVDHDETLMRKADWIVDLGPGGGALGGQLMAKFRPGEAKTFAQESQTARHLSKTFDHEPIKADSTLAETSAFVTIELPMLHNLQMGRVRFAKSALTVVTGVSGAGKSSLVFGVLVPSLQENRFVSCQKITGHEDLGVLTVIDRNPVAKSSVSMPASYLDIFTDLRKLFAALPDAQIGSITERTFSLASQGGRCEECKGRGEVDLKMRFLADARIRCPVCFGQRYRPHVLEVKYAGLSMADVLNLTLDEAAQHFKNHRRIARRLGPALELGLGYLKLGQTSASLSGGEAQRLKLVPLLGRHLREEKGVIVIDEPTTGLHFEDAAKLVRVIRKMVDLGNTVIVVEHHSDVIMAADWVVDLGPGSATEGGRLVYEGPPSGLLKTQDSETGRCLRRHSPDMS